MPERLLFHFSLSCTGEGNEQPTPVFLPGESQGRGSLVGCRLWGRTESDTTEATQQQQHIFLTSRTGDTFVFLFLISPSIIFSGSIHVSAAAADKSLQSCPTLCDPIDGSPPGSPVPGILQARTQEWVAVSFSNA